MALIVEDGTSKVDSESYISVLEATAYHKARGNADAWDAIDDKEASLRRATEYMMQVYRLRWTGYRVKLGQSLDWPRAEVWIPDSSAAIYGSRLAFVPINVIPVEVKRACAELALQTASGALAPNIERATVKEQVGPISVEYDRSAPQPVQYRAVDLMLLPYLGGGGANTTLVRA